MPYLTHVIAHMLSSFIFVIKNFVYLIFSPYKTMRRIAKENDYGQLIIILAIVVGYFLYAQIVRQRTSHPLIFASSALVSIVMFCVTFFLITKFFFTVFNSKKLQVYSAFFYKSSRETSDITYKSFVFTFAYSLLPTFIWFYTTSTLYYLLPPPRTASFLGKGFSLAFVSFSVTLLLWRIILSYLSIRFAAKASFYEVLTSLTLFSLWFFPYSYLMYKLEIFRVPFM